jgi:hypothetical protein
VDKLIVVLAACTCWQLAAKECIPNHDASKGCLVLVLEKQIPCGDGIKIARTCRLRRTGKPNEDLCIPALGTLEVGCPSIEIVGGTLADFIVVELDKQSIEGTLLDDVLHLEIPRVKRAFRSCSDEVLLAGVRIGQFTELVDHGDIAALVVCRAVLASIVTTVATSYG